MLKIRLKIWFLLDFDFLYMLILITSKTSDKKLAKIVKFNLSSIKKYPSMIENIQKAWKISM